MHREDITKIIQQHLRTIGCATCDGNKEKLYCQYCTPVEHNNMWHISKEHADIIADDIIQLINQDKT